MSFNETLSSNMAVHSFLVNNGEYNKSPHFLDENKINVRKFIESIVGKLDCKRAVDFGCGTGFIIELISDLFEEVHGVDITPEMLEMIDEKIGNVILHQGIVEDTPYEDCFFDFASAYSFMDHLFDYEVFLQEAYRVLRFGGIFYSDLNPNRKFILNIENSSRVKEDCKYFSPIVEKEVLGSINNGLYYEEKYGLDAKILEKAEPVKSYQNGFDPYSVLQSAREIGFREVNVDYQWFLGQANYTHSHPEIDPDFIECYLREVLPASAALFKYLRFVFIK